VTLLRGLTQKSGSQAMIWFDALLEKPTTSFCGVVLPSY